MYIARSPNHNVGMGLLLSSVHAFYVNLRIYNSFVQISVTFVYPNGPYWLFLGGFFFISLTFWKFYNWFSNYHVVTPIILMLLLVPFQIYLHTRMHWLLTFVLIVLILVVKLGHVYIYQKRICKYNSSWKSALWGFILPDTCGYWDNIYAHDHYQWWRITLFHDIFRFRIDIEKLSIGTWLMAGLL